VTIIRRLFDARRARGGPHAAMFERFRGEGCVALDLETTGLDTRRDAVLSLAAVPVDGRVVRLSQALSLTVRGATDFRIEAMRHHRLRPQDIEGGAELDAALDALLRHLGNRPILGYAIAFDIAVLDRLVEARHGFRLPTGPPLRIDHGRRRRAGARTPYRARRRGDDRAGVGAVHAWWREVVRPRLKRRVQGPGPRARK